jgi:RND family efflux transporter MFP subunit
MQRHVAAALGLLILAGCSQSSQQEMQLPPPQVTVRQPVEREVTDYAEATGRTEAKETYEVRVRVKGFLQSIKFCEGALVKKGDLLYEIDPRTFEADLASAEAEVARMEAQLKMARSEADRAEQMRKNRAISEEEYTQKVAAHDTAAAGVQKAKAAARSTKLELEFTRIVSPIDGMIGRTLVTEGNLVGYNDPTLLTTVVRLDPIYVYFDLPERDILLHDQRVREQGATALTAKVPAYVGLAIDSGHPHRGCIDFRDNKVDPGTGTIRLRAVLENKAAVLTPGLFCRVKVPIGHPQKRLLVPESAIGQNQKGRFILTVGDDDKVTERAVKTGTVTDDGLVVVEPREGKLTGTEWVVVAGLLRARVGEKVTPQKSVVSGP